MMNGDAMIPMATDGLNLLKYYAFVLLSLFRIRLGSNDLNQ